MSFRMRRIEHPVDRAREIEHESRLDVQWLELAAVGPAPERYEAAEIRMQVEGVLPPCVLQFARRQDVQQLIDGLVVVRDAVWPKGGE